ncbi:cupin-like domain-containing protein [Duganella fentianensis]|uniref:cupin-like domain-containing protein n=1 Tax=Duganella fentianensis TaxID=2692177 RepID=UPI0032B1B848
MQNAENLHPKLSPPLDEQSAPANMSAASDGKTFSDDWRTWIAENIVLSNSLSGMHEILIQQGFSEEVARSEIELALQSPYLKGSKRLQNKLLKRDWVLGIYQKLSRLAPQSVPRCHQLSGGDFLHNFYMKNQPVIITGMMDDWAGMQLWSMDYFKKILPDAEVQIQWGREKDPHYEANSETHRKILRFEEYIDLIETRSPTNDFYMTANNDGLNKRNLSTLWKDIGPLKEYLTACEDRQGFLWLGPAGTLTPFHHDLTNNLMAQVVGRKRIKIIPAHDITRLPNPFHCFTPLDGTQMLASTFPVNETDPMVLECVIEPGEILFLPVGSWHFVEALDISATMSFTNFKWDNDFYSSYPDHTQF